LLQKNKLKFFASNGLKMQNLLINGLWLPSLTFNNDFPYYPISLFLKKIPNFEKKTCLMLSKSIFHSE